MKILGLLFLFTLSVSAGQISLSLNPTNTVSVGMSGDISGGNNLPLTGMDTSTQLTVTLILNAITTLQSQVASILPNYYPTSNPSSFITAFTPSVCSNGVTRSIITATNAANGWLISSNKWSFVNYSTTVTATSTISGSQIGTIVLEIASSNSTNATDWKEVARNPTGQALSLAVVLQSIQTGGGQLCAFVNPNYYARLRSINTSGSPSFVFNSGQEVIF